MIPMANYLSCLKVVQRYLIFEQKDIGLQLKLEPFSRALAFLDYTAIWFLKLSNKTLLSLLLIIKEIQIRFILSSNKVQIKRAMSFQLKYIADIQFVKQDCFLNPFSASSLN